MAYSTIDKPNTHFNPVIYTGNGSTQSITGVNFQPDFVWLKERNNVASHKLYDIVRGATEVLESDGTYAEGTDVNGLTAFNSDGFSLGSSGSNNGSGDTYASWNWKAGGTAVSNTAGSITSSVSANTDSGFSIVSYTGNGGNGTVGHGLGVAPKMVIIKTRSGSGSWVVGHDSMGWGFWMPLDATNAKISSATMFQNTAPTSTVFSENVFGTDTCIAYCFAEKKGFSKYGSYAGNGSGTDGTFVYLGFKPALVVVRSYTTASSWNFMDNKRQTYNDGTIPYLKANFNGVEITTNPNMDFLSNGFKFRTTDNDFNGSGQSYIYMAFAEAPIVGSNNVPANAR